jgi:hypothetical protein
MTTLAEQATARGMSLLAAGVPLTLLIDLVLDVPPLLGESTTARAGALAAPSPAA